MLGFGDSKEQRQTKRRSRWQKLVLWQLNEGGNWAEGMCLRGEGGLTERARVKGQMKASSRVYLTKFS